MTGNTQPALESSLQKILANDLRFRVLTVGKSGAGKTSLIKEAFKITSIQASDEEGKCNISDELCSEQNRYFVLHDSQGFELGEMDNMNKVKDFLSRRASKTVDIKERLHAVWLCIRLPEGGGPVIATGEEELIKFASSDVPIIIVFTQYDNLYNYMSFKLPKNNPSFLRLNQDQQKRAIEEEAETYFQKECVDRLKQLKTSQKLVWIKVSTKPEYAHTLVDLTHETEELIKAYLEKEVWVAVATAQRVGVDLNVEASMSVGLEKYWRGMASGDHFAGTLLRDCFDVIHRDIVDVWNFRDPRKLLQHRDFKARILSLVRDLAEPISASVNDHSKYPVELDVIKKALDVVAPSSGPIILSPTAPFARRLVEIYEAKPHIVGTLMGYIVDLIIVLDSLFRIPHDEVMEKDIEDSIGQYSRSEQYKQVHKEIRSFVAKMEIINILQPHEVVVKLIEKYRPNFAKEMQLNDRYLALGIIHTEAVRPAQPSNSLPKQKKRKFLEFFLKKTPLGKKQRMLD